MFDRAQRVLELHGGGGTRQRRHNHYLKGVLWCGRCGRRFIIMRGKGNGGVYFYFICRGRQDHGCTQPYLRVEAMEVAVTRHYATVQLSEEFQATLRAELDDGLLSELRNINTLKKRLNARLRELEAKEDEYLELVGSAGWPKTRSDASSMGSEPSASRSRVNWLMPARGWTLAVSSSWPRWSCYATRKRSMSKAAPA